VRKLSKGFFAVILLIGIYSECEAAVVVLDGSFYVIPAKDKDRDGYTVDQGDCNDNAPSIYPGATEICEDGIDQDCDGKDSICPPTCDSYHLSLCTTSATCIGAGGYWYYNKCNASPPVISGYWSGAAVNTNDGCKYQLTSSISSNGTAIYGSWSASPLSNCDKYSYGGSLEGTFNFQTMRITFGAAYNDDYGGGYLLFDGTVSQTLRYMNGTWEGGYPNGGTWYQNKQ